MNLTLNPSNVSQWDTFSTMKSVCLVPYFIFYLKGTFGFILSGLFFVFPTTGSSQSSVENWVGELMGHLSKQLLTT